MRIGPCQLRLPASCRCVAARYPRLADRSPDRMLGRYGDGEVDLTLGMRNYVGYT